MLNNNIFYHQATRKTIVAFGTLFSGIKLLRSKNGVEQTIAVPIAYSPKEKWIVRIEQDPSLENHTYTLLPKMSFEITGMSYDASRKTNRMSSITATRSVGGSAVAISGQVEIRPMMNLALSYDHRLIDGKQAVTFLIEIKKFVENPALALLQLTPSA